MPSDDREKSGISKSVSEAFSYLLISIEGTATTETNCSIWVIS